MQAGGAAGREISLRRGSVMQVARVLDGTARR